LGVVDIYFLYLFLHKEISFWSIWKKKASWSQVQWTLSGKTVTKPC